MKALVKKNACSGLWLMDVPVPSYGADEVLIKVQQASICGTDIHIYDWDQWAQANIPLPMTIGHEFVGEIVAFGSAVTGLSLGQTVSAEGHIVCWNCRNCRAGKPHMCAKTLGLGVHRPGCFAEFLVLPATNVITLPPGLSTQVAAILDPLGNAVHCATSFPLAGKDILITGAGPIGLMLLAVVRHMGANRVVMTDVNEYRLDIARKMGATYAVNVQQQALSTVMASLEMQDGFAVGFEMSGQQAAWHDLLAAIAYGGNIAILGIPASSMLIDWNQVIFKGLTLRGIYGREMFATWDTMLGMLQSNLAVSPVITHEFSFDQYQEAFALMRSSQSGKVTLYW